MDYISLRLSFNIIIIYIFILGGNPDVYKYIFYSNKEFRFPPYKIKDKL